MISGKTKLVGLVGHPVTQVKMPSILNPYLERMGQDVSVVPFDVAPIGLEHFVDLLRRADNFLGTLVTVPHKQAVARQLDSLSDRARVLGAVNVVRRELDGSLHGDHLDGFGFLNALRRHGFVSMGKSALVIGVGGAGSAIAYALCETGIRELCIVDLDRSRLTAVRTLLKEAFGSVDIRIECTSLERYDLILNATAIGMHADDPMPLPQALLQTLNACTLVGDVVTLHAETPWLRFASSRGCRIQRGAEMTEAAMGFIGAFLRLLPPVDPLATVLTPYAADSAGSHLNHSVALKSIDNHSKEGKVKT